MRKLSKIISRGCLIFALVIFLISPAQAAPSVTLKWDPSRASDVAGYRLYYGTSSRAYTQKLDIGSNTATLVSNLAEGRTYFFAVTAYNAAAESSPSNEVSYTVPLETSVATPAPMVAKPAPMVIAQKVPSPSAAMPIIMPPAKLNSIHDMQEHPRRPHGSVEAWAYARWCEREP